MLLDTDQILLLVTIFGVTGCLVCICRSVLRPLPTEDNDENLQEGVRNAMVVVTRVANAHIKKENKYAEQHCPICLDIFKKEKRAVKLPCEHIFHRECIERWFEEKLSCPLCQEQYIIASNAVTESDDENNLSD